MSTSIGRFTRGTENGGTDFFGKPKVTIQGSNAVENAATGRTCTVLAIQVQYFVEDAMMRKWIGKKCIELNAFDKMHKPQITILYRILSL